MPSKKKNHQVHRIKYIQFTAKLNKHHLKSQVDDFFFKLKQKNSTFTTYTLEIIEAYRHFDSNQP